ncbi:MAG: hypothetical protein GXO23_03525 [Crenarchaeota archaeon]|nr:hypothetical protein [Thermoproteota archaeon]
MITAREEENLLRNLASSLLRADRDGIRRALDLLNIPEDENREKIVRRALARLYGLARRVRSESQYRILAALAVTCHRTRTIEDLLDHLSYIATLEDIEVDDLHTLTIRFRNIPLLAVDLAEKIVLDHEIETDDDITIRVKLGKEIYLDYIIRRTLYPLAIATELTDLVIRRARHMTVRRLFEIHNNILEICKENICRNIKKLIDNKTIEKLELSEEITIIDYTNRRIVGKILREESSKESVIVEQIDKLVKIGDLIILWHM